LSLRHMSEIYSRNYKETMMNTLRANYTNRCFRSMLIQEVLGIERMSDYRCKSHVDDGSIEVDLVIRVRGMTFFPGEIVPRCELVSTSAPGSIYGKALDGAVSVSIKRDPRIVSKAKDLVPVVVQNVRYAVQMQEITMRAQFLWPDTIPLARGVQFELVEGSEPEKEEYFRDCVRSIQEAEEALAALKKNNADPYKFFDKLLEGPATTLPSSGTDILTASASQFTAGTIVFRPAWHLHDRNIYTGKTPREEIPLEKCTVSQMLLSMAEHYLRNVHNFRVLIEDSDNDKVMESGEYWKRFIAAVKAIKA